SRSDRSRRRGSPTSRRRYRAPRPARPPAAAGGCRVRRSRTRCRSRRWPRSRAASGRGGRPSPRCTGRPRPSSEPPPVFRDPDELLEARLELLLARAREPLLEDREQLGPRAAVHEDDEAEAELLLVDLVQVRELCEHGRVLAALLGRRLADARVRRECGGLVLLGKLRDHLAGRAERVLALGEQL